MKKTNIKISGMHCASCSTIISRALKKENGVLSAEVNFSTEKAAIEYNPKLINENKLLGSIKKKGYKGHVITEQNIKLEEKRTK